MRTMAIGTIGVLTLLLAWRAEGKSHSPMDAEEQLRCFGGSVQRNHLCKESPNGEGCNGPDTSCAAGDDYCDQEQDEVTCADTKDYKDTVRCLQADTQLCCDDEDQSHDEIVCYDYYTCTCKFSVGTWACEADETNDPNKVRECKIKTCPPTSGG